MSGFDALFGGGFWLAVAAFGGVSALFVRSMTGRSELERTRWLALALMGVGALQSLRALGDFFFENERLAERVQAALRSPEVELPWLLRDLERLPWEALLTWGAGVFLGAALVHAAQVWRLDATIRRLRDLRNDASARTGRELA